MTDDQIDRPKITDEAISTSEPARAYEALDNMRPVEFTGWMIGRSSTEYPGSPRWTELRVFRTAGGQYLVQKIGASRVYHRRDGCKRGVVVRNPEILETDMPCPVCKPPGLADLDEIRDAAEDRGTEDPTTYRKEVEVSRVEEAYHPRNVPNLLLWQGKMTVVATDALNQALRNDPELREILLAPKIIA